MRRLAVPQVSLSMLCCMLLSMPATAESIVWPSAVRASNEQGQLLYSEDWLSATADGKLSQWDIFYRGAKGETLGRRSLVFRPSAPYRPEVRLELASGDVVELQHGERWVHSRHSANKPRAVKSWPEIRKHMAVDLALLRYLVENREAIIATDIDEISNFVLALGRREHYQIEVLRRPHRQGEALTMKLYRDGLFSSRRLNMSVDMMRASGRILSARGQHALLQNSEKLVEMQFFY